MTVKYGKLYTKDASGNLFQIIPESQTIEEYQGATSTTAGSPGLVPGALSTETNSFLKGNGQWAEIDLRNEDVIALAASDIDLSLGRTFTKTLSGNTTFTISNSPANKKTVFTLGISGGSSYTVTWPNSVSWNGGTEPTLGAYNILSFITLNGGTNWYGNVTYTSGS